MDEGLGARHDGGVSPEDVLARLAELEVRTAHRLGMPEDTDRSAAAGIRQFRAQEERHEEASEASVSLPDPALQRLFLALCARYGVDVYRRPKQRKTSVTVSGSRVFIREVLGKMFQEAGEILEAWYVEQTEAVLREFEGSERTGLRQRPS